MGSFWRGLAKHSRKVRTWLKEEKSVWAWLVNLVIAFILIKFIIYPGLGLILGSSLPVVAVVSSSMDHDAIDGTICGVQAPSGYKDNLDGFWNTCGAWYEERGISKEEFSTFPLAGGFNKGDIMVLWGRGEIAKGDIVVYSSNQQYPIIHRVWYLNDTHISTKGDHNSFAIEEYVLLQGNVAYACHLNGAPAPCFAGQRVTKNTPGAFAIMDETQIPRDTVYGETVFRIPWLGYVKIWFTDAVMWIAGAFR